MEKKKKGKSSSGVSKLRSEESTIMVSKTYLSDPGKNLPPESKVIKIRQFVTDPARIRISKGLTLGLGDFQFARVDVSVDIPCYREEIPVVFKALTKYVEDRVQEEAQELTPAKQTGKNTKSVNEVL